MPKVTFEYNLSKIEDHIKKDDNILQRSYDRVSTKI